MPRLIRSYQEPFPHATIDGFLPEAAFEIVSKQCLPEAEMLPPIEEWHHYSNVFEEKYALDNRALMPPQVVAVIEALESAPVCSRMAKLLLEDEPLIADPSLNGAGIHRIPKGGYLDIHTDASITPRFPDLERRMNAIFFIHPEWRDHWGGHLEIWKGEHLPTRCVRKIVPKPNRLVLFEAGDRSFHGHPTPLNCPEGVYRTSIALYYFSKMKKGEEERQKVRFVPLPDEQYDPYVETLRQMRADPEQCKEIYRSEG